LCVTVTVSGLLHAKTNSEMAIINSAKLRALMLFPRSKWFVIRGLREYSKKFHVRPWSAAARRRFGLCGLAQLNIEKHSTMMGQIGQWGPKRCQASALQRVVASTGSEVSSVCHRFATS